MRMLSILVLALAVTGCGNPDESAPDATVLDSNTSAESSIALPESTVTLVRFTMPGMT